MKPEFERFETTGEVIECGSALSLMFVYGEWSAFLSLGTGKSAYYGHWLNDKYSGDLTREEAKLLLMKLR